uniref:Capsid protein n=1 Tax=Porure totivirus 1 TaxID=2926573 RepID=A0AA49X4K4_9VIRU|nr:MAG: capsid protein [Porure totivirus 1]
MDTAAATANPQQQQQLEIEELSAELDQAKVLEEAAQGVGAEGVLIHLPQGAGAVRKQIPVLCSNLERVDRGVYTDTNFLMDESIVDRARQRQHLVVREGNLDSRIYQESGQTTQNLFLMAGGNYGADPVWFVVKAGKRKGIHLVEGASLASLRPLFRGVEVGPFSSSIRMDANIFSMNAVLAALQSGGYNADSGHVSFIEPLARGMCMTLASVDRGASPLSFVGGLGSRLVNPVAAQYPGLIFPGADNVPRWDPADTVARIVNVEDFCREARGEGRFDAGWGPAYWGAPGMDGVAVVPIRLADASVPTLNTIWTLMHMEHPISLAALNVQWFENGNGAAPAPLRGNAEITNTSATHIAGPTAKVLFVVTDLTGDHVADVVLRVLGGGVVGVEGGANYVIAGVDQDIGDIVNFWLVTDLEEQQLIGIAGIQRWTRYLGNEEDWQSALHLVSLAYVTFNCPARRWSDMVENAFYYSGAGGQPPFPLGNMLNWEDLAAATGARFRGVMSGNNARLTAPWSGYRFQGLTPQNKPNALIVRMDPVLAVGTVAHFWGPEHRQTSPILDRAAALADCCFQRGKMMAATEDIILGQMGVAEETTSTGAQGPNIAMGLRLFHGLTDVENEILEGNHRSTVQVTINGHQCEEGARLFLDECPESAAGTMRTRVNRSEYSELGFEADLPVDDLYQLGDGQFVAANVIVRGVAGPWDILRYPLPQPGAVAHETFRNVTAMGGWTRAQTLVTNLMTSRSNGLEVTNIGIPIRLPTESIAHAQRWGLFAGPPVDPEMRELPLGGSVRSVTVTNHSVTVGVSGGRNVVLGKNRKAELNPVFVNRTGGQTTSNTPVVDSEGMTTDAFLGV